MSDRKVWRLRNWILLGYSVPIAALVVSALTTIYNVHQLQQRAQELSRGRTVAAELNKVEIHVHAMSRATRGYLIDDQPRFTQEFETNQRSGHISLDNLQDLIIVPKQKQRLARLTQQFKEVEARNLKLLALVSQGKKAEAIAFWKQGQHLNEVTELTQLMDELQAGEEEIVAIGIRLETEALNNLQTVVVAAAILSVLFSIALCLWIVAKASNQMNSSATIIASSASQIAASIEEQERITSQQAASVNETTTTMDQLGSSSRLSAEQAATAASGARQALELADGGTRAVERTLKGMVTLRDKVGAIADQILRLSEQTNQIGSISGLVSDLANQTNMLALNAAVEAVRAGEHGKGFAVVSNEIRKLADQSRQSAAKINALVVDIQNAINSTVMATDEGTKTVEEGVRIADETADAFSGVAEAVNNVALSNQQISLNIQQQAAAVQQVVEAMNSLNAASKESALGITQVKVGTQQLNRAAKDLQTVI